MSANYDFQVETRVNSGQHVAIPPFFVKQHLSAATDALYAWMRKEGNVPSEIREMWLAHDSLTAFLDYGDNHDAGSLLETFAAIADGWRFVDQSCESLEWPTLATDWQPPVEAKAVEALGEAPDHAAELVPA